MFTQTSKKTNIIAKLFCLALEFLMRKLPKKIVTRITKLAYTEGSRNWLNGWWKMKWIIELELIRGGSAKYCVGYKNPGNFFFSTKAVARHRPLEEENNHKVLFAYAQFIDIEFLWLAPLGQTSRQGTEDGGFWPSSSLPIYTLHLRSITFRAILYFRSAFQE